VSWERLLPALGLGAEIRASKFVAYFQLVDACARPGCPVCRCLRESAVRTLDALLYEQVTDPGTRAELDRSWGFCNWHAWMSREVQNAALGIAIIYLDLLEQTRIRLGGAERELRRSPVTTGWRRLFGWGKTAGFVNARAERARCPLCRPLAGAEGSYVRIVLDHIQDPEFERAYAGSAGLCLPHLTVGLTRYPDHRGLVPLLARTNRKLEVLTREVRGFIDKHDYRKRVTFTPAEATSWTDALGFLVGRPGLFGQEIPRSGPTAAPRASGGLTLDPRAAESEPAEADEPAAAATASSMVQDLRAEIADLKRRLAKYEPPAGDAA
jgi:hypothetical protein